MTSLLQKLRGRSVGEFRERVSQGLSRWLERRGLLESGEPTGQQLATLVSELDGPVVRGPFFASLDDRGATLDALRSIDAQFEAKLRAGADRVLSGRYDLIGHYDLSFGDPVDWHVEPVSGVRAPERHWSEIDFLDPVVVGDHKLVWELARHRGLVTLAQAWWCTGDTRYADGLARLLESWLSANPPKRGVHWVSSLELSFRAMAWVWVLALAGDALDPALRRRAVGHLAIMGRHIERYLSTWFSPNTHLTGEALGLFVLGTALPQCRDARRWVELGARILQEWLPRHVRPDGTYVEQSTWYHRYTTDFYIHFLVLAERSGLGVRGAIGGPVERLLEVLTWITRPDGTMPLIGDDDGGRLLFLDEGTAHETRTPLAVGAALFGRGDFASVARSPTAEMVWLLGPSGLRDYRAVKPAPAQAIGRAFPDGGLYVMRSGWDSTASVMTLDAGPHGFLNGGHAHADALSVDVAVHGQPVLVDPGTFTYTTAASWRDHFRETASHCAATVDGCGSASSAGPFQWASRATARCVAWYASGDVALFVGSHDGFERLKPDVRYRRSVAFIAPDLWIVRDEITGEGEHDLAVHWQCATSVTCAPEGDQAARLNRDGRYVLTVQVLEPVRSRVDEGSVSPTYGAREAAPRLTHVGRGLGRTTVTTLLSGAPDVQMEEVQGPTGASIGVSIRQRQRQGMLLFGDASPDVETDAAITWIDLDARGRPAAITVAGAHRLSVEGHAVPIPSGAEGFRWQADAPRA